MYGVSNVLVSRFSLLVFAIVVLIIVILLDFRAGSIYLILCHCGLV